MNLQQAATLSILRIINTDACIAITHTTYDVCETALKRGFNIGVPGSNQ